MGLPDASAESTYAEEGVTRLMVAEFSTTRQMIKKGQPVRKGRRDHDRDDH